MTVKEAVRSRHSVRQYQNKPISAEHAEKLQKLIEEYNAEGNLHFQLIQNEPRAFDSLLAHYGKFTNVKNYIALIGRKSPDLEELCGYFGEKLVIEAQQMGLHTCWVGGTFSRVPEAFHLQADEKLVCIIAVGYGENQGVPHKSKPPETVVKTEGSLPEWVIRGVKCAMLAPTALNQQKFSFAVDGNKVTAKAGLGFFTKIDLGIVKYHFEVGAGKENFEWK
ncbi:MAG: nitroreductase family protein [Oscillospiraceae bacterium]|nr:nitroreductase family protein [Oscillospiraceae bacterium]